MPPISELPGSMAGRFRLIQRLGGPRSGSWKAEDPGAQKAVALRVLTRSLPADAARRAALLERVRQRALFHHPGFPAIDSVWIEGDALLLVEELVEGTPLSRTPMPLEEREVLKLAWQLADALRTLHARRIVHGALDPDHIVVVPDGFRITGISLAALTAREDRGEERLLHSDEQGELAKLSFRAPEQISSRGVEVRSDVFSAGAVLYAAITGKPPFAGTTATEIANAILRGSPRSPLELNPRVPIGVIAVVGKCLMKDPVKRFQDMQQLQEELRRLDPKIETWAGRAPLPRPARAAARSADAPFILGLIPYFELLEKEDAEKARRLAARMQQSLGEAVLLADGAILDSLGARFVATIPSPEDAVVAMRRAAAQIAEQNASAPDGEILEATILAHSGSITLEPGSPGGPALEQASRIVTAMEPGQMLLTAPVASAAGLTKDARPLGTAEGIGLFAVPPEEEPSAAAEPEAPAAEPAAAPPPPAAKPRRAIAAIAAAAAVFAIALAAIVFWPRETEAPPVATAPATTAAPADPRPQLVLEPFSVDGTDPEIVTRAAALEEAVRAMLATSPDLRLLDRPASEAARRYGSRSVPGGTKDQITIYSMAGAGELGPVSVADPVAASTIAAWIAKSAGASPERIATSNPEALAAYLQSLVERRSGSNERAAAAIRTAFAADPNFLPIARAAVTILSNTGDRAGAIAAAESVARLDRTDVQTRRQLVTWIRESGDDARAIPHAAAVVQGEPDPELITYLARQALSAGDAPTFQKLLSRLQQTPDRSRLPLHPADATAARGQLAVAVQQYYELEPRERKNPFLSLKIARIDVLRHSIPAAELELEKLRALDPTYSVEVLAAYLAAEKRDAAGAAQALARAAAAPNRSPDFHTAEAEVYAILSDHRGVLGALGRAIEAQEPTFAYILSNPLFAYLKDEPEFAPMRARMEARQQEIRTALQAVR